ncbi:uncharacterized protein LOC124264411 [Haliotis rubra]|uniref:uncharacterized protein LOC124264411 n=1 Tax=Haliotis rubra TaxID=36100 RepID=UPI001EE5D4D9|nr:uncharacterized protein LOC124264411 [Haliotis rubra]
MSVETMLSESVRDEESFTARVSRHRRLADVRRGAGYTRTVDSLADRQWNAHAGRPMAENPKVKNVLQLHSRTVHKDPLNVALSRAKLQGSPDNSSQPFNPWGASSLEFDKKLTPDTKVNVGLPKRGVMMSRVAGSQRDRPFRTNTNFRSRNGTIRIIEPLHPLPPRDQRLKQVSEFDPEAVEREKTYLMLRRIDQILHPAKMFFRSEASTSEIEIVSQDGDSMGGRVSRTDRVSFPKPKRGHLGERLVDRKAGRRAQKQGDRRYSFSLSSVIDKLEKSELDAYRKCQIWVDRCSTYPR